MSSSTPSTGLTPTMTCGQWRMVGAHLYRIFPKLGVSPRAALRDALSRQAAAPGSRRHVGTSARPVAYTDDGPDG